MTPDRPLPDDLTPDELASAHVDGLATPEQVARIEADPDLVARVARLQAARDAVRLPDGPPDPDRREVAIAAALAEATTAAADPGPVVDLSTRRRAATRWLGWAAAAAAAVALAVALPRVLDRSEGSQDTTVAAAPKSSSESAADDQRQTADSPLSADASTSMQAPTAAVGGAEAGPSATAPDVLARPPVDLGSADDLEDLVEPARQALADGTTPDAQTPPPSPEDATCLADQAATATAPAEPGGVAPTLVLSATAAIDGARVLVLVVEQPDGTRELLAIRAAGCELLGTVGL
jgi:hypothetical protein